MSNYATWIRAENDPMTIEAALSTDLDNGLSCLEIFAGESRLTIHDQNAKTLEHLGHCILDAAQKQKDREGRRALASSVHPPPCTPERNPEKSDPHFEDDVRLSDLPPMVHPVIADRSGNTKMDF